MSDQAVARHVRLLPARAANRSAAGGDSSPGPRSCSPGQALRSAISPRCWRTEEEA
jgi:hypothetical protein